MSRAQIRRLLRRSLGDRSNSRTSFLKIRMKIAQRAKVLMAERSAKMAQKDEDEGLVAP